MPTLKYFAASGAPRLHSVHKALTTVGKGLGNDVAVQGQGVAEHHCQILFDGRDFVLEELDRDADISINGKRKRRARLVHGDRVHLVHDQPPELFHLSNCEWSAAPRSLHSCHQ